LNESETSHYNRRITILVERFTHTHPRDYNPTSRQLSLVVLGRGSGAIEDIPSHEATRGYGTGSTSSITQGQYGLSVRTSCTL
jgi:hypothetical protein